MSRRLYFLIILALCAWPMPSLAKFLYYNDCALRDDPSQKLPSPLATCVNANAGTWIAQKSKTPPTGQPPIKYHADGRLSLFVTPWLSYTSKSHSSVYISNTTKQTTARETIQDLSLIQIGNNALSRHRISFGRGNPVYRLDHNLRKNIDYAWGLYNFEATFGNFATYTYDNQLDMTIQLTYGINPDRKLSVKQRALGAGRIMYDLAALEGTRIAIGSFGDGTLHRAASFGMLNVNGAGAETCIEMTRAFATNPYDPKEFNQNIRLSYLSQIQDQSRLKFQYDDQFKLIRLVGLGGVYYPSKHAEIELHLGYAKQEDIHKYSHFYGFLHAGIRI